MSKKDIIILVPIGWVEDKQSESVAFKNIVEKIDGQPHASLYGPIAGQTHWQVLNQRFNEFKAEGYKYICIVPINLLVPDGFVGQLKTAYNKIQNSGIISIRTGHEKNLNLKPLLHNDDTFDAVWVNEHNTVRGLLFFDVEVLNKALDFSKRDLFLENIPGAFKVDELAFAASFAGLNNYYIRNNVAVKINIQDENLFPVASPEDKKMFREYIGEQAKAKYNNLEQEEQTTT